ncbi:MAG: efflux RND transporter periplasmic adaptor subunit [Planctomycetota bacterium]|nr:efflux RND transporter periplasmic adaptor subunit [Planctomycetota bacterium]MDA1180371.1 efflux RND transporter periplasmic adaptor subunit [Planctomycetota bacterium]
MVKFPYRFILVFAIAQVGQSSEPLPLLPDERVVDMLPASTLPWQFAEISSQVDGLVTEVHVQEGNLVVQGQPLASLDSKVSVAAVAIAAAQAAAVTNLELAEIQSSSAKRQLARVESAHLKNAASASELEDARNRVAESDALVRQAAERLDHAKAVLQHEQAKLDEYCVRAPFDGSIVRIQVRVGENASRSKAIVTLANLKKLRADLFVPAKFFGELRPGMEMRLEASAPVSRQIMGQLEYVEPMIDAATSAFRCVVSIPNENQLLPSGFQVRWCTEKSQDSHDGALISSR